MSALRRLLLSVVLLTAASVARADLPLAPAMAGRNSEAGVGAYAGWRSAALLAWRERESGGTQSSLSYVYAWRGVEAAQAESWNLLRGPNGALQVRLLSSQSLLTAGGFGVMGALGGGLNGRLGTAAGGFSALLGVHASAQGAFTAGQGGAVRFPVGLDLGLEGKLGSLRPFALLRPTVDLQFDRPVALRMELGVGAGWGF